MSPVPELGVLGERLAAARARPSARRRLRPLWVAVPVALAVAVPALAGRPLWAPLVDGETAVPPQAPASVQTELVRGRDGWRLVAYRARLRGGGIGTCLFLTSDRGGAGSCSRGDPVLRSTTHADGLRAYAFARVPEGSGGIVVRWSDGHVDRVAARTARLRGGGTVRYAIAVRRGGLRTGPPALVSVGGLR
jgi:hypothetical protein